MRTVRLSVLALVLALSIASDVWAVDEGQTQPRLDSGSVSTNATVDVIPLTSGSGNIKGFQCVQSATLFNTRLHFYVDGGAAQTIDFRPALLHVSSDDSYSYSDMVPTNIRFGSSIRVTVQKLSGTGYVQCTVSWGLD